MAYELSVPKRTAKYYHHQDCTGDVHHGFCGRAARIVGFDVCVTRSRPQGDRLLSSAGAGRILLSL